MEVFDEVLGWNPNQISRTREDVELDDRALLDVAGTQGNITEQGIRDNLWVGIQYIESWLRGHGAVALNNLMEDAATAEISRSQIWQWIHSQAITDTGELITYDWVKEMLEEEFGRLPRFEGDRFEDALEIFTDVAMGEEFPAFLTTSAYANYLHAGAEQPERELTAA